MSESQKELKDAIREDFNAFRRLMPEMSDIYDAMSQEAYKGGIVGAKEKRLMALCAALVSGCRGCILYQSKHALDLGASVDEILETCAVAISLGGTMAAAESTRLMRYLRELGEIE